MMSLTKYLILVFIAQNVIAKAVHDDAVVFRDSDEHESEEILNGSEEIMSTKSEKKYIGGDLQLKKNVFQGDIKLTEAQKSEITTRTGVRFDYLKWPKDDKGSAIVPYKIDAAYEPQDARLIRSAMDGIERYTCIRFVKRTTEVDYINIQSDSGCSSYLGKIGSEQSVSLESDGCMEKGIIQHELIHALGYDHMHSHIDRDKFISIKWANIHPDAMENFDTVNPDYFDNYGTNYDLNSVMHYHSKAFSVNGEDTIVPKNSRYRTMIGQRIALSSGDAKRLNNMYNCKK